MRFVCVPCDKPMQLLETRPPDNGSIALVYSCADCGYEFAMLTNPHETQLVGSLGVRLGDASTDGAAAASKCPFTGVVQGLNGAATEAPAAVGPPGGNGVPWTAEAEARLARLPEFVRPMIRQGIEQFARDQGHDRVDERVLDAARESMGV